MPSKLLTPKQVARAVGISESTLKRWCDGGRVPVVRTAGGHRRLRHEDVLQCVRDGVLQLENAAALGLPPAVGKGDWTLERAKRDLVVALNNGAYDVLHQAIVDLYLCGHTAATICDRVIAPALVKVGEMWGAGEVEVYQERRAVGLVLRALHSLQRMIKEPPADSPVAIGGTTTGDDYSLATVMVELSLREIGWRATSLGGPLPFDALRAALVVQAPRLFWLSVSVVDDREAFLEDYAQLFDACPKSTALVVGGRGIDTELRTEMRFAACCANLGELSDFASALQPAAGVALAKDLGTA